MNKLISITSNDQFPVGGRELHESLSIETPYHKWFPRQCEGVFVEGEDFRTKVSESTGGRPAMDHCCTIGMAKELCMLQRTEKGREVRRYLIDIENQWNQPEAVMARALKMADRTIGELTGKVLYLEVANSRLSVQNQIMAPKADYFDDLVDRNMLTGIRETAKELHVKQGEFVDFLLVNKYVYREKSSKPGKTGKLMPYMQHVTSGLFELKERINEHSDWSGTQVFITPKGRETFRLLLKGRCA